MVLRMPQVLSNLSPIKHLLQPENSKEIGKCVGFIGFSYFHILDISSIQLEDSVVK